LACGFETYLQDYCATKTGSPEDWKFLSRDDSSKNQASGHKFRIPLGLDPLPSQFIHNFVGAHSCKHLLLNYGENLAYLLKLVYTLATLVRAV